MKEKLHFFFILFLVVCTTMYAQVDNGIDSVLVKKDTVLVRSNKAKLYIASGTVVKLDESTARQVEVVKIKVTTQKQEFKIKSAPKLVKSSKKTEKLVHHLKANKVKRVAVKSLYTTKPIALKKGFSNDYPIICPTVHHNDLTFVWVDQKIKIGYLFIENKNLRLAYSAKRILNTIVNRSLFSRPPLSIV